MRNISASMQASILNKKSSSMLVKAEIDPSRTFFLSSSAGFNFDAGDYSEPTDTPVGQCMIYSENKGKAYTFIVDSSTGVVYGMVEGDSAKNNLGITANPKTKPSALDMGNGTAKIYYWNNSPSALRVSTVNLTGFTISNTQDIAIGSVPSTWSIEAGSPTVIDESHLVLCYKTSKGGIGIAFKDGSFWSHWKQRFMSPNTLTELEWTVYTSAVAFKDKIFVYSTDVSTGTVRAVEYNVFAGSWSDLFIALPADFSRFDISNAIVANGYVHLAGQFHRTGEHAGAKVYSLVLRSSDGKHFSWDRFTLLSNTGYRYHIDLDNDNKKLYASDRNSVGSADMSYYFTNAPSNRLILEPPRSIITFSINNDQATMRIVSDDEKFIEHPTMRKGNRLKAWLGYKTTDNPNGEYVLYGTYIIDKIDTRWADGKRSLVLQLVNEGIWKTEQIAFPFYAELLSKSSLYDNCDSQDKMYVVPCFSGDHLDYLTIDFWYSDEWDGEGIIEGQNFSWCGSPQSNYQYVSNSSGATDQLRGRTVKLNAHPHMKIYPTIIGTIKAKLFGWETGLSTARQNSTWTLYAVTAPEDDLEDISVTTGIKISSYQNFPKENYSPESVGTQAGSYPIEFEFSGIEEGHKLLYFGITASNTTAGQSIQYLERIEVHEGLSFFYSELTSSSAWKLERPEGEERDYLVSPESRLQNLMFTLKPYSSFNFNVVAEFGYSEGSAPLSPGTTAWGVVGLAKDGQDYICARYKRQNNKIELCLFRRGKTTILAEYSTSEVYELMLDHRNGLFRVWIKNNERWEGPVISYSYDEITYGVLSTSETGIMHTGIYSAIYPPGFLAAAFAQPYSDGICMTTDQPKGVLDGFPNSGYIVIDSVKYKYGRKTTKDTSSSLQFGPVQLRQVTNIGTWLENGITYSGIGIEVALYKPTLDPYAVKNLLLGQSNHYNWIITQSDWTIVHSTAGQPDYLRNRSKHYSDSAVHEDRYGASISDKCYIGHGLRNIEIQADQPYYHRNGALCSIWSTDKIWVKKVVATQVDHDATVEDMLRTLSYTASIEAHFPGKWEKESIELSGTPSEITTDYDIFPGGADIRFSKHLFLDGSYVNISLDNLVLSETEKISIGIEKTSSGIYVYIKPTGTTPAEYVRTELDKDKPHDYRILIHDDFISFYADDQTLATLALGKENLEWPTEPIILKWSCNDSNTKIYNVEIAELFDWREAIYIESEMAVSSAISSVIQERPIEIYSSSDGSISFSYRFKREEVSYTQSETHNILREHHIVKQNSNNAGSDALIYYTDIAFVSNSNYAENDGFNTRVFRLPSLETGAKLAGEILLEKAYEKQLMHTFIMRPDLRLEVGDILNIAYLLSGTNKAMSYSSIIEGINLSIEEGKSDMNITARGA